MLALGVETQVWELDLDSLSWRELSPYFPCTKQCRHIYGG